MGRALMWMQNNTLRSACTSWRSSAAKQRQMRESVQQALQRWVKQSAVKAFGTWRRATEEARALHIERVKLAVNLLRDSTRMHAWNMWCVAAFDLGISGELREKWRRIVWR
eukprot:COSAG05_NODE_16329_length_348_cov_1.040161_1_plen_110_part_01